MCLFALRETWLIEQILTNEINKQKSNYQVREVSLCQPKLARAVGALKLLFNMPQHFNQFRIWQRAHPSRANKSAAPLPQMEK